MQLRKALTARNNRTCASPKGCASLSESHGSSWDKQGFGRFKVECAVEGRKLGLQVPTTSIVAVPPSWPLVSAVRLCLAGRSGKEDEADPRVTDRNSSRCCVLTLAAASDSVVARRFGSQLQARSQRQHHRLASHAAIANKHGAAIYDIIKIRIHPSIWIYRLHIP
eukprot:6204819-Pleurochrysis_carterae.AAC.3